MKTITLVALAIAARSLDVSAQTVRQFTIDDAWGRDSMQFRTTAPLEEIVGTTNEVTGTIAVNFTALTSAETRAQFIVDVSTIKTGIDMRDGAVRKSLGGPAHTTSTFTLTRVKSASPTALEANAPVKIVGEGTFELNGIRKTIDVAATLTYVPKGGPFSQLRPGNFVKITSEFDVRLADFNIDRSGPALILQVGEIAHVTLSVLASDATAAEAEQYRQNAIKYMGKARR